MALQPIPSIVPHCTCCRRLHMNQECLRTEFQKLMRKHRIGSLATLTEQGQPLLAVTPFAINTTDGTLVIHVSELGAHTRNLLQRPQAAFMVCAREPVAGPVHSLPRASFQVHATVLARGSAPWNQARACYLTRFPDVEFMMDFTDFHLFRLEIVRVRQIAGFGIARTLPARTAVAWLKESDLS